ncbi:hypothetical protein [Enterobacter chuandaensis]|uniref:hypothetical protein n=1 Tax=Enterobacter chuandaensis TaxID=2497875 RepID=UPI0020C6D440|nr:hypothetical protein [Enterobacter chuandaensis]
MRFSALPPFTVIYRLTAWAPERHADACRIYGCEKCSIPPELLRAFSHNVQPVVSRGSLASPIPMPLSRMLTLCVPSTAVTQLTV